jgi:hypothetical protein
VYFASAESALILSGIDWSNTAELMYAIFKPVLLWAFTTLPIINPQARNKITFFIFSFVVE